VNSANSANQLGHLCQEPVKPCQTPMTRDLDYTKGVACLAMTPSHQEKPLEDQLGTSCHPMDPAVASKYGWGIGASRDFTPEVFGTPTPIPSGDRCSETFVEFVCALKWSINACAYYCHVLDISMIYCTFYNPQGAIHRLHGDISILPAWTDDWNIFLFYPH